MKGYIKSYFKEKAYGFIDAEDNNSYFMHINDIWTPDEVIVGKEVTFTPSQTGNGLKAIKITINNNSGFIITYHNEFIESESKLNELLKIDYSCPPLHASGDSQEEAKRKLLMLIKSIGANGVKNMHYFKTKGSNGNYIYTIHNYSGEPSLIFSYKPSNDEIAIRNSKNTQNNIIKSFEENYKKMISESESLKIKLSKESIKFLSFIGISICIIAIIVQAFK